MPEDIKPPSAEPAGDRPAPIRRRRPPTPVKKNRTGLRIALLAVLLACAALTAVFFQDRSRLGSFISGMQFSANPDLTRVFGKRKQLVLVMGIDENWTDQDQPFTTGARTDTLLATSIDMTTHDVGVLSIPRDLWVQQPKKGGFDKINQAYADGGPQRSELVVQQALGTPPFDYYFVLRLDATKNIINAIGGLDVPVDKDMDYDDNWGHLHIHLKKGVQHLNGEQTVGYIRFRHDEESDFGRMRRQREVVQLLARRMKEPGMAARVPALLAVLRDNVRTDMPPDKLFNLALAMRKLAPGKVHSAQLPADVGTVGDASVLFPQAQQTRALVARYLIAGFGKAFDPSTVHVRVENGSGTPGAASALAQYLRQRGFTIVGTGNGKTFANRTTKITGVDQSVVAEVAKRLPIHGVKTAVGPVLGGDVDILIGRDYRTQ